jgi:hypothetical protein
LVELFICPYMRSRGANGIIGRGNFLRAHA